MSELQTLIKEVKLLREDFAKFKQAQNKKEKEGEVWVTANLLSKRFDVNHRRLQQLRRQELIKFKTVRPGVIRYLLTSAEHILNKQSTL